MMATTTSPSAKSSYVMTRHMQDSTRLFMQSWLWLYLLGYNIHPLIPFVKQNSLASPFRIADVGCGNAAWLIDVERNLTPSEKTQVELHGFDISGGHFPPTEDIPENIVLTDNVDAFAPPPEEMVEKFDVVHVRLFMAVVRGGDPVPLIRHAIKLLKPGGYIQWDEWDTDTWRVHTDPKKRSTSSAQAFIDMFFKLMHGMGFKFSWIANLDKIFRKEGLEVLEFKRYQAPKLLRKAHSDDLLGACENIGAMATDENGYIRGMPDHKWETLWQPAIAEFSNGVTATMDPVLIVGRKPAQTVDKA